MIPNKAFQALACGAPLITADTAAARELLADGQNALLVPAGDPPALAAAIRRLLGDPRARGSPRAVFAFTEERAREDVLGARWRADLERVTASAHDSREPRSPR